METFCPRLTEIPVKTGPRIFENNCSWADRFRSADPTMGYIDVSACTNFHETVNDKRFLEKSTYLGLNALSAKVFFWKMKIYFLNELCMIKYRLYCYVT